MNANEPTAKDKPLTKPTQEEVAEYAYAISTKEGNPQIYAAQKWRATAVQMQHFNTLAL